MKTSVCFILVFFFTAFGTVNAQKVRTYTFEELDSLQLKEKRSVIVFIGTSWCKYCGLMKQGVLNDKEMASLLNTKTYFVELDAEYGQPIRFAGGTFNFKPAGKGQGVHELAAALGTVDGQLVFPTICVLNFSNDVVFRHQGFMSREKFGKLLSLL